MSILISSKDKTTSRRQFGHVLLAGAVGVGLTACGGGSDPTGVTDETSNSKDIDLRKAYDRITRGMDRSALIEAVGMAPNSTDESSSAVWSNSTGRLSVTYNGEGIGTGVGFKPSNGPSISKYFN
jgi:hypothetical protein